MAEAYARGATYTYSRFWPLYTITGGMHDWAGSLGIASITPELLTGDQSEFPQNLAGLQAVLVDAEALLPLPADGRAGGHVVPAPIFRFWRALGAEERFGLPLEPARYTPDGITQTFARARIGLRHALVDTPFYVQPEALGARAAASESYGGPEHSLGPPDSPDSRRFPESGQTLSGAVLDFWERGGGVDVFGLPLSPPFEAIAADGQQRTVQYLERAVLALYAEDGGVRLEPLGASTLALERLALPGAQFTVR
jgi:hypothetical protein